MKRNPDLIGGGPVANQEGSKSGKTPKKNSTSSVKKLRLAAVGDSGRTPLEILLRRARSADQAIDEEIAKGEAANGIVLVKLFHMLIIAAKAAADFLHPRLSAVLHAEAGDVEVTDARAKITELFRLGEDAKRGEAAPNPTAH
jgi:hypothetical protein